MMDGFVKRMMDKTDDNDILGVQEIINEGMSHYAKKIQMAISPTRYGDLSFVIAALEMVADRLKKDDPVGIYDQIKEVTDLEISRVMMPERDKED